MAKKLHRVGGQGFRLHTVFRQRVFLRVFRHQNQDKRLNINEIAGMIFIEHLLSNDHLSNKLIYCVGARFTLTCRNKGLHLISFPWHISQVLRASLGDEDVILDAIKYRLANCFDSATVATRAITYRTPPTSQYLSRTSLSMNLLCTGSSR